MRLRRFTGATPRDALAAVKATLGSDAVILATKPLATGGVEITAAVDTDPAGEAGERGTSSGATGASPELAALGRELAGIAARVARIDRAMRPGRGVIGGLDDEALDLAERLALNGTAPETAERLARSFALGRRRGLVPAAALAASVERHFVVAPAAPTESRITAFVGATGAGKTTTIAKLAARAVARGAAVGLVMADTQRIGAAEQLGTYARLLDVPVRTASDGDQLVAALADFERADVVYVDTAGLAGDGRASAELARMLAAAGGAVTTTAVIPAGASETALRAAWQRLAVLAPATSVVTKVDEGGGLGAACAWLAEVGVPLDWLGTGTRVPDDVAVADGATVGTWLTAA